MAKFSLDHWCTYPGQVHHEMYVALSRELTTRRGRNEVTPCDASDQIIDSAGHEDPGPGDGRHFLCLRPA